MAAALLRLDEEPEPEALADAVASFTADGYLVFPSILPADASRALREEIMGCEEVCAALAEEDGLHGREVGCQPFTSLYSMGSVEQLDPDAHGTGCGRVRSRTT